MKSIILAAGEGTRLRPLTNDRPKCMVELFGKPLLQHQVEVLRECGIEDIIVVTGYLASKANTPGIRTIHNPRYAETNMVVSLFCAEAEFTEDILISYGDIVFHESIVQEMIHSRTPIAVAVDKQWEALWRIRMEDPLSDAETLKLANDGTITELGKKPDSMDDIEGQYIGMIRIRRDALKQVQTFYKEMNRSAIYDGKSFDAMYMTSFLSEVRRSVAPLQAVQINGGWCEVDSLEDLEAYTRCGPGLLTPQGAKKSL